MNCKQGDIAMIVSTAGCHGVYLTAAIESLGRIVNCVALLEDGWWTVEPFVVSVGEVAEIHDDLLRPIRDPGEDAQDEMLRPLPLEHQPA